MYVGDVRLLVRRGEQVGGGEGKGLSAVLTLQNRLFRTRNPLVCII